MSDDTPRLGSFTAYLESTQGGKSETAEAPVSPITVLEFLSRLAAARDGYGGSEATQRYGFHEVPRRAEEVQGSGLHYCARPSAGCGGDIDE